MAEPTRIPLPGTWSDKSNGAVGTLIIQVGDAGSGEDLTFAITDTMRGGQLRRVINSSNLKRVA